MRQLSSRFRRFRRRKNNTDDPANGDLAMPKRKHMPRPLLVRILTIASGVFFILLGIISGFIPILQGWIFILIGLGLLSRDVPLVRRWLKKAKERFPKQAEALRRLKVRLIGRWRKIKYSLFQRGRRKAAATEIAEENRNPNGKAEK